ncbi:acyl carrier protein [Streptomyces sp. GS7]|uniref:acyl carrier protein n=1 Tax=Streptomyces sp. GS7 TaxID=2692234 RepID=UPI001318869E|nr:phosphopantetheine-binding protein [Streptomyces sp. GS7]QHC26099.1 acyl carrier protein [Streptomyces sp. GS7]
MQNPYEAAQIHEIVREGLAQVLGTGADEITPDATLVADLGAESLDLVEFRFEMETKLGVALPKSNVLDLLATALGGSEQLYDERGGISELAAEVLRRSAFGYSEEQVHAGMRPYEVAAAATSAHWASFTHAIFDHLPATCTECGADKAELAVSGKAVCAGCGAALEAATGDEVMADGVRAALEAIGHAQPVG